MLDKFRTNTRQLEQLPRLGSASIKSQFFGNKAQAPKGEVDPLFCQSRQERAAARQLVEMLLKHRPRTNRSAQTRDRYADRLSRPAQGVLLDQGEFFYKAPIALLPVDANPLLGNRTMW